MINPLSGETLASVSTHGKLLFKAVQNGINPMGTLFVYFVVSF